MATVDYMHNVQQPCSATLTDLQVGCVAASMWHESAFCKIMSGKGNKLVKALASNDKIGREYSQYSVTA